ncbi:MAG TPA: glycine betaine/L-proline ABC transporter ATP-binding protein [Limnochordales bacterium]|nr:glycine betaine/L-proline ABC transporter ATP-binding protein [Limnochordales bacterium]
MEGRSGSDHPAEVRPAGIRVQNLWKVFAPKGVKVDVHDPDRIAWAERSGAVVAVRDVSFEVKPGELFVVMGLSGSGKSTLIRCLLRLVEPTAGTIVCNGHDVTAMNARELTEFRRHHVAMVFQHYGLLPHRTVLENAAFGLKLRGVPREERYARAREALARVGLAGWGDRYPAALSGGMQQRVGIARALANDPAIMLWDEPFSGLDPLIRREMQDELVRLQRELRKTIVFVTHDLDEAIRLGDRMAVMKDGRLVQVGTPREIVQNPVNDYVRRFVQARAPVWVDGAAEAEDWTSRTETARGPARRGEAACGAEHVPGASQASPNGGTGAAPADGVERLPAKAAGRR